jgi:hypothetical protein
MPPHPSPRPALRRGRIALGAIATTLAVLALGVSSALAFTGSVYFDNSSNAAAGGTLFNGTFTGGGNVGLNASVMPSLTTGSNNVASGTAALRGDTTGSANVATGSEALYFNTDGSYNVAYGTNALQGTTTGSSNTALGLNAGRNLTTGSNNVDIANDGKAGESNAIRIGTKGVQLRAFIAGISGKTISGPTQRVVVNANGQLGTASAAAKVAAGRDPSVPELRAQNRRQAREIAAQTKESATEAKEIASLKREVAKLSRR